MYAGIHHATNLGRMFRPEGEPLLPNWRHIPVGYHGRAGTIAVSGTEVVRPCGHIAVPAGVEWAPTGQLDIELELAVVIGAPSRRGERVPIDDVDAHVFGMLLLNDWSARDIQAFEYQPLGPFLGKSFLTSVSSWLVPFDALTPAFVEGLPATQDPKPAEHLRTARPSIPALHLEVALETAAMRAAASIAAHRVAGRGGRRALLVARAADRARDLERGVAAHRRRVRIGHALGRRSPHRGRQLHRADGTGRASARPAERRDARVPARRRPHRDARLVRIRFDTRGFRRARRHRRRKR